MEHKSFVKQMLFLLLMLREVSNQLARLFVHMARMTTPFLRSTASTLAAKARVPSLKALQTENFHILKHLLTR